MRNLLIATLVGLSGLVVSAKLPKGIDWHRDVEEAMVVAGKKQKPLFLYWGASWCPPCNKLKKYIFSTSKFKEAVSKFVPVYLDGDHPSAQKWGEKFNARGYPTVLILRSNGSEVTRLPNNIAVEQYVYLMEAALENTRSADDILRHLKKFGGDKISLVEWQILAGHSWSQEKNKKKKIANYKMLYNKVPDKYREQKAKFLIGYLSNLAWYHKGPLKLNDANEFRLAFDQLIRNDELFLKSFGKLSMAGMSIIKKLYEKDLAGAKRVTKVYLDAIDKFRSSKLIKKQDRLGSFYPFISHYGEKGLPPSIRRELISHVKLLDKETKDVYLRQDIMGSSISLLRSAKMYRTAERYALQEIEKSPSPYYFMKQVSYIKEAQGDIKGVISWRQKSWANSVGHSTRFKFGTDYILTLLKLAPTQTKKIVKDCGKLFKQILKESDAFSGRNNSNMKKLGKSLNSWGTKNKKSWRKLQATIKQHCTQSKSAKLCQKKLKGYKLI